MAEAKSAAIQKAIDRQAKLLAISKKLGLPEGEMVLDRPLMASVVTLRPFTPLRIYAESDARVDSPNPIMFRFYHYLHLYLKNRKVNKKDTWKLTDQITKLPFKLLIEDLYEEKLLKPIPTNQNMKLEITRKDMERQGKIDKIGKELGLPEEVLLMDYPPPEPISLAGYLSLTEKMRKARRKKPDPDPIFYRFISYLGFYFEYNKVDTGNVLELAYLVTEKPFRLLIEDLFEQRLIRRIKGKTV